MLFQFILLTSLFVYCFAVIGKERRNLYGICQATNLCRTNMTSCEQSKATCLPIVVKCQNGSCRFRRFCSNDVRSEPLKRWYFDPDRQRCRPSRHQINNVVYFRFVRDCRRVCATMRRRKQRDHIIQSEIAKHDNNTAIVHLYIDVDSTRTRRLVDWMNVTAALDSAQAYYASQIQYIQDYRRRFTNFVNAPYRLMLDLHSKATSNQSQTNNDEHAI